MKEKIVGIADMQFLLPRLVQKVGQEYVIIDEKKKLIVGKLKVLEAPKRLVLEEIYKRKKMS